MAILSDGPGLFDGINYPFVVASPGKGAEILLEMEGNPLAGHAHKLLGNFGAGDREGEFVGLDAATLSVFVLRAVAGEDHHAFVGLENIALAGDLVELSGLDAFAEDIVETEVAEGRKAENHDYDEPGENFFERCHIDACLRQKYEKIDKKNAGVARIFFRVAKKTL